MPSELFSFAQIAKGYDPYATTRKPKGSLPRPDYIRQRIRPDPVDNRQKVSLTVRGGSMVPALRPGNVVVVYLDSKLSDIKKGDMVTFIADIGNGLESFYTHRVVEITSQGLVTKGDSIGANDRGFVTNENFLGYTRRSNELVTQITGD